MEHDRKAGAVNTEVRTLGSEIKVTTDRHACLCWSGRRVGFARVLSLSLLCTTLGCGGPGGSSWAAGRGRGGHGAQETAEAMAVATVHLEPRDLERTYATSGTLRAIRSADIVATQPAVIVSLPVQEGDRVKAGDVLAQLDSRNTGLQAAQNRVQLENLQRELDRLETAAPGVFSAEEIDKQRYAVAEARAALKLSKHQVGQTVVRAPFAGTIVARKAEVGTYASSSTVLVSLADLDVLELDLHIPERDAATVKSDATVDVELVDGTHFAADLVRRSPVVDPLTGTTKFTVRAEKFPEAAAPGAFVRATLLVDSRLAAPSVPRSAVFEVEGKPHVFVVVDGKARRRPVVLGLEGGEAIEIVEGLEPTDVVVLDGNAGITEGMPLKAGG